MIACHETHSACAKILIQHGANIHIVDRFGHDALMMSAYFGDRVTTQLLIDNGADVTRKEKNGRTALDLARKDKLKSIIKQSFSSSETSPRNEERYRSESVITPRSEYELYNDTTDCTFDSDLPQNIVLTPKPKVVNSMHEEYDKSNTPSPFRVEKSGRISLNRNSITPQKKITPLMVPSEE